MKETRLKTEPSRHVVWPRDLKETRLKTEPSRCVAKGLERDKTEDRAVTL